MSASTRTAQAGIGYGGLKSALAALALVVILAATIAVVALGVSRSTATPATQANPVPAPIYLDKGSRDEMNRLPGAPYIIDRDKGPVDSFGNESVPGLGGQSDPGNGGHGTRFAQ